MKTFYIETFGCQMNAHDSEKVIGTLLAEGYAQVPEPEQADLVLYNTCSIRDKAEQKVFSRLQQFKRGAGKGKTFAVLGCVAQQEGERIFEKAPHVSLVCGSASYNRLPEMLVQLERGDRRVTGLDFGSQVRFVVLSGAALSVALEAGRAGISNPGPHGLSQILYAWGSSTNNNGSAFAGLNANTRFYNVGLAVAMWLGRFGTIVPVLALAGNMASKKRSETVVGKMPTHGPLFVGLLIGTIFLVGALTYVPALALGPVAEHLQLFVKAAP